MSHRPLHAHADITFGSTLSCMNMLWHVLITRQSPLFLRVFCESIGSPAAAYHLCCNESTAAPPDSIPPFPTEHNASDFRSDTRFCLSSRMSCCLLACVIFSSFYGFSQHCLPDGSFQMFSVYLFCLCSQILILLFLLHSSTHRLYQMWWKKIM